MMAKVMAASQCYYCPVLLTPFPHTARSSRTCNPSSNHDCAARRGELRRPSELQRLRLWTLLFGALGRQLRPSGPSHSSRLTWWLGAFAGCDSLQCAMHACRLSALGRPFPFYQRLSPCQSIELWDDGSLLSGSACSWHCVQDQHPGRLMHIATECPC